MTIIEIRIGDFDFGLERGLRCGVLGFGMYVTSRAGEWCLSVYSEWSFFYRYKSWRWPPRRKEVQ